MGMRMGITMGRATHFLDVWGLGGWLCSPVSCIHWVTSGQLSLLEDEMRRMERVNVSPEGGGVVIRDVWRVWAVC